MHDCAPVHKAKSKSIWGGLDINVNDFGMIFYSFAL